MILFNYQLKTGSIRLTSIKRTNYNKQLRDLSLTPKKSPIEKPVWANRLLFCLARFGLTVRFNFSVLFKETKLQYIKQHMIYDKLHRSFRNRYEESFSVWISHFHLHNCWTHKFIQTTIKDKDCIFLPSYKPKSSSWFTWFRQHTRLNAPLYRWPVCSLDFHSNSSQTHPSKIDRDPFSIFSSRKQIHVTDESSLLLSTLWIEHSILYLGRECGVTFDPLQIRLPLKASQVLTEL